jgi:NAD(P)-dependent dehydrogenase (short-subunit alcohol dehydrogenase family)
MSNDALGPGNVAVVTGGGTGIGEALAHAFAARGLRVVVVGRRAEKVEHVAEAIRAGGGEAFGHAADVTDLASVEALAAAVTDRWGGTHVLVNNAGVTSIGTKLWDITPERWRTVLGANLDGVYHGVRAFLPGMIASGEPGHVLTTVSMAGLMVSANTIPYTASKHAALALSESLDLELQQIGAPIRASALIPSAVRSDIFVDPPGEGISPVALERQRARMADSGLDPTYVAELALEGIAKDDVWIHSHPEVAEKQVRARTTRLLEAIPEITPTERA